MPKPFLDHITRTLQDIDAAGMYKRERQITSPQGGRIDVQRDGQNHKQVVNLCANNYLGLANNPRLSAAAKEALDHQGFGMVSVRFICGALDQHLLLEQRLAAFLGKEDAILFAACFDATGGVFEPLLSAEDAIISDALNHASIIDGIRLCKAKRYRYANSDMAELEARLREAKAADARHILIAIDGVFSMDGHLAKLPEITALAQEYDAIVMVDDCHATGFMGPQGRGTPAHFDVVDGVDILTGTLGKALGGAIGGYIAGPQPVIDLLRQRARPYLFSNSLPPMIVAAGLEAIKLVEESDDLRVKLFENTAFWRAGLEKLGFDLIPGPIGIMAAAVAKHIGARHVVITDINQDRLDLASKVADVTTVNVADTDLKQVAASLGVVEGFDVGMEMSGSQIALDQMIGAMVMGGRIAMLGIPPGKSAVDWSSIVLKSITIKGVYGREIFETWYKMLAMLQNGLDVSAVITHHFKADDFEAGFAAMKSGSSGKVVLDWTT